MRIAIDSTAILGPMSRNRGIGNYTMGLFPCMINRDSSNEYFFLNLYDDSFFLQNYVNDEINEIQLSMGHENFLLQKQFSSLQEGIIRAFIDQNHIDVFYITSPFDDKGMLYKREWFSNCQVVMIVYDIIPYVMKNHYFPHGTGMEWYMERIEMIRWADQIQVISQSVKDDLVKYLGFDAEKIKVIWGAVDGKFKVLNMDEDQKTQIASKFGIDSKFIMCTGGDDERKNIESLIVAYSKLDKKIKNEYQLVIVCKLSPSAVDRYSAVIEKNNAIGRVILTNFVTDDELVQLYNMATLMAFPSKYEGFGLPVVEAWACDTNVLTSNNSSLVQIAGDAAIIVNPQSVSSICEGLRIALTETDMDQLLMKGKERLKLFQWDVVADSSLKFLEELNNIPVQMKSSTRIRIAMFTPLPPMQSGIADYSFDIINELIDYLDIDVYIDEGYKFDCRLDKRVNVYSHNDFCKRVKEYQEIIYQVGNSDFHSYMFPYIKKYSGIVVLHDYNLHGIANYLTMSGKNKSFDKYAAILLEDYNKLDVDRYIEKLKQGTTGYRIYDMPVNGFVINYAKKVIVHSFEAKKKLLLKDFGRNARQIWSYSKFEQKKRSVSELRDKFGYSNEEFVIAAFGHIHETKRAIPILEAFSRVKEEHSNCKLVYVGKLDSSIKGSFRQKIRELGIEEDVRVTGYVEMDEFKEYISITDLCLNLRYPYNGETSGSLMRIFAEGKCVVVNDIGSFGEFPDEICVKLPSVERMSHEEEIEKITNAIMLIIENDEIKLSLQESALNFARENLDIKLVAKEYYKYILANDKRVLTERKLQDIISIIRNESELQKIKRTLEYVV